MEDKRSLEVLGLTAYSVDKEGVVYPASGKPLKTTLHRGRVCTNLTDDSGKRRRILVNVLVDTVFPELVEGININGYSDYKIRSTGEVYSLKTSKVLKATKASNGYKVVNLKSNCGAKKVQTIHRLVAEHFVEGFFTGAHVNHIDGDKLNNSMNNLEWCTNQENRDHAWDTGLMVSKQRKCILSKDNTTWVEFDSLKEAKSFIEKEVGCTMPNVGKLSKCAKDNGTEGKTNRGILNTDNPFRCRGYIVKYND